MEPIGKENAQDKNEIPKLEGMPNNNEQINLPGYLSS